MSPSGQRLWSLIDAAKRQVRRDGMLAVAGITAMAVPLVLVVGWLLGGASAWIAPSPVPLLVVAVVAAVATVCAWRIGRRWVRGVDEVVIAMAAEARRGLPPGSVRGIMELSRALPAGTSPALYQRAESELARNLSGATVWELSGAVGELARQRRQRALFALAGLTTLTAALGFLAPERSRMGWAPLMHPVAHLLPPALPALVVEPGNAEVPRGGALEIEVVAPGRREVVLMWRPAGDVSRDRRLAVAEDRAVSRIGGIDAPLVYWVIAPDGAVSDTFRVTPLDPLLLSDLIIDVVYPSYLGRDPDRFEGEAPPLEIPAGTEIRFRGRATRRLREVVLERDGGGSGVPLEVTADRFSGRWTPRKSGIYHWRLADETGGGLAGSPAPLELTVIGDAAPSVEITFPGTDTVFGPELVQRVIADARDDHGLREAHLVSWRVSALGERGGAVEQPIPLQGDADLAVLTGLLDASDRQLLAGDELHYFVRVVDNSPARQEAVSQTYVLRLPGRDELRDRVDEQAESMIADAESLARSSKQLAEDTREMARRTARSSRGRSGGQASQSGRPGGQPGGQSGSGDRMGYQELEQAKQLLNRQEAMVGRVEEMRERTAALEQAMREAGLQDPGLQQRLNELKELYNQIVTPELAEQLAELRRSIDEMDPQEVQQALEQLAKQQEEFRERVEQSLELLRRAAVEQEMNALAREANELAAQQQALAEEMKTGEATPERATQQKELAERTDSLLERLRQLQQQLGQQGETQAAEEAGRAGEQAGQARSSMQRAAEQAKQQQGQQAGQSGEQAAANLEQAAQTLESARESMAEAWREEVQQSMQQAANDALALAQRQSEILRQMQQAQQSQQGQPGQQDPQRPQNQQAQQGQQGQQGQQPKPGQRTSQGQQGQQGQQPQQGKQGQQGQQGQSGGKGQQSQQGGQGQQGQQNQQGQQGEQGQSGGKGQQSQQGGQPDQTGQRSGGSAGQGSGQQDLQGLQSEQVALQQGLEALGRNLSEAERRSAMVDRDVSAALGRAAQSMEQTLDAMSGRNGQQRMPLEEAQRTVDALNQLALALLENGEQIAQSESGTGLQEALKQLADLAKQQGALTGQSSSLLPMDLGTRAMGDQLQRMAQQQREVAKKLGGMNDHLGGSDDVLGQLDALAREAEEIARELSGGRLTPEILARQENLFHRLLDAGRTLEREEVSEQRVAERPSDVGPSGAGPLDAALLNAGPRYPAPDPATLRSLPPAYRRLILEYFDRLNRGDGAAAADREAAPRREDP